MITIRNDFHNRKVTLRTYVNARLTLRQIRRARRELCGSPDCTCGGVLGERGPQDVRIQDLGLDQYGEPFIQILDKDRPEIEHFDPKF